MPNTRADITSLVSLRRDARGQQGSQYFHLSVILTADSDTTPASLASVDNTAPRAFTDNLHTLLMSYSDIFAAPTGLPPEREFDHRIPLLANTSRVNVRPYRYPHNQKTEIEQLVGGMMKEGIIRLSTSPFSSPVILVKKRTERGDSVLTTVP